MRFCVRGFSAGNLDVANVQRPLVKPKISNFLDTVATVFYLTLTFENHIMNTDILYKAKKDTLVLVKEEAEKSLAGIQKIEDVITDKSNGLMRILISFFILIFGYSINSITNSKFNLLLYTALMLAILIGCVIWVLYINILPLRTGVNGTNPSQLLQSDIISGDNKSDEINLVRNRVYSLEKAIEKSLQSHKIRHSRFMRANKILVIGLSVILIVIILCLLVRFFPLCQCI